MRKRKRRPTRLLREIIFWTLMSIALAAAGFSGYQLFRELKSLRQGELSYRATADLKPKELRSETDPVSDDEQTKAPLQPHEVNEEYKGWISIPGTRIDYPVVHTTDNSYYLNHLFDRTYNAMGCIFIDARNNADFQDRNTAIYGHHMKNGTMFADLEKYKSQEFFDTHPDILYTSNGKMYRFEPFAGCLLSGMDSFLRIDFAEDEDFRQYIDTFRASSVFQSSVEVSSEDRIVTLVTCSYDFEDARFAVFARLVELQ